MRAEMKVNHEINHHKAGRYQSAVASISRKIIRLVNIVVICLKPQLLPGGQMVLCYSTFSEFAVHHSRQI
jgi:hypothetical protein